MPEPASTLPLTPAPVPVTTDTVLDYATQTSDFLAALNEAFPGAVDANLLAFLEHAANNSIQRRILAVALQGVQDRRAAMKRG